MLSSSLATILLISCSRSCSAFTGALTTASSQISRPFSFQLRDTPPDAPIEPPLNPLLSQIKPSKTVEVFSLVKQMEAEGETVTSLCVGEPDFAPPQCVLDAATKAMTNGQTRYTAVTGTLELRQAIADDLKSRKGIQYNPMTEIVVGNGAKQCVYQGLLASCGAGDEVIIPAPYWPSYPEMALLVGATPVILETSVNDGYLLNPTELEKCLKEHPKAKALMLCNPSNPTGGVHSTELLLRIAKVLEKYPNVVILSDEIYERLVYTEDGKCTAFASLPNMFHRTITLNGFSKSHAMTGFRLGYLAAPARFAKATSVLQGQITSCASSVSQAAGVAALREVDESWLENNAEIMKEKRDYVLRELSKMEGVSVAVPPNGAFYVLPDVSSYYGGDDTQLCLDLLKEKKLALVPGESFGAPGTVRISYATSMEELEVAMTKLREFLETR
ncbi:aspartate aminotransferase [Thalassiosira pseudonana CCMP1335]|uniref:Aspartate aminotransferase n=1 Tax=Thalassiosira pseudonana TaxID=35128 RepID=B8CG93_THAPS|nr:aspartate aminotransferase [Thalassiosira pseudonana CCMP1335]EED87452.1 aspartate aminotransferase [Thalassiosira pseudonana CCMP1335]|eukprot:scaffold4056_cov249-Alexandrium_tamarense.AAC.1